MPRCRKIPCPSAPARLLFRLAAVVASVLNWVLGIGQRESSGLFSFRCRCVFRRYSFLTFCIRTLRRHKPMLASTMKACKYRYAWTGSWYFSCGARRLWIGFLLPLLGFGVSVAFLSLLLRLLLQLGSGSSSNMGFGRYALLCLLLVAACALCSWLKPLLEVGCLSSRAL